MTWNGGPFDPKRVGEDLQAKMIDKGLSVMMERGRSAAVSMVDPETGSHPLVFAWRTPPARRAHHHHGIAGLRLSLPLTLNCDRSRPSGGNRGF
jgi:hypothetical protein